MDCLGEETHVPARRNNGLGGYGYGLSTRPTRQGLISEHYEGKCGEQVRSHSNSRYMIPTSC